MAPPRARAFSFEDIENFDDEALRTFLDPHASGVDPADIAAALHGLSPALRHRVDDALPDAARRQFRRSHGPWSPRSIALARRRVVDELFWPLLYWNSPDEYEDLVAGEYIHPRVFDLVDLDGRVVCDIGAGSGRFTIPASRRARRVIAVDAVPALLRRLEDKAHRNHIANIEFRRGAFAALPLADGSVDVAVACSAFTSEPSQGAERAIAEAERVVRESGEVVVIWPDDPNWFRARGFVHLSLRGNDVHHFPDLTTAERICDAFYSPAAAEWVRRTGSADVPYQILGVPPPSDVCVKRVTDPRNPLPAPIPSR